MKTRQTSIQVSAVLGRQIDELRALGFGPQFTDIVRTAVDRMYQQEATMNAKRIERDLEIGFFVERADGITVSAAEVDYGEGDICFAMTFHKGEMPTHASQEFATAKELLTAMAAIAPLASWQMRAG